MELNQVTNENSNPQFVDWGLVDYQTALEKQMQLVETVFAGKAPETIIFCSHPPVVTLGRGTQAGDVFGWKGPIVEISRGGRATYHGPSQLVAYPIIDLSKDRVDLKARDLHGYLRSLERAIVQSLKHFGIQAVGATHGNATGVWVGDRKVASIGIGVRRWISYHGIAINLDHDPSAFQGLKPCGFSRQTMISLEELIGSRPNRLQFQTKLQSEFEQNFKRW